MRSVLLFTRIMFEDRLRQRQFKPRLIIRKGYFVGVFLYNSFHKKCFLTFRLSKSPYPVYSGFDVADSGPYYYKGVPQYEQSLIDADEVHIIPCGYDLRLTAHRELLRKALGGNHRKVQIRLFLAAPLDLSLRFEW